MPSRVTHGYRAALREPLVRRLWLASLTSTIGDYVALGALLFLAADRTGLTLGAAIVVAVGVVPSALTGILGGRWLDRTHRARTLAGLQLLGGVIVCLPVLFGGVAVVIVTAAGLAGVRVATVSVRSGAMAEGLDDVHRGPLVALLSTTDQAAQVLGYLAGAGLYVAVGADAALLLDAATFVVGALLLLGLPLPEPDDVREPTTLSTGVRTIAAHPALRLFAVLTLATGVVGSLPEVLAPTVAGPEDPLRPFVLAAAPAGQALVMTLLGRTRAIRRPRTLLVHFSALAGALGLAALARTPGEVALANLLIGAGAGWYVGAQLLFLRLAPPARMAQVTGAMVAGLAVADGLGSLGLALLADLAGSATAYATGGALLALMAVGGTVARRRSPTILALDTEAAASRPDA